MPKNISLGQYYPASSPLHRLDPRAKVIISVIYITAVFLCKNVFSFALILAASVLLVAAGKIPPKMIFRGIKPIVYIMVFTAFFNIFWTSGEHLLLSWWVINIYLEGIVTAVLMILRIVVLITGTSLLLTYTTTPIALTDALEQLLAPLKKIRLPVHEFAMMMTIALRFIPTLMEETDKIISAQKARGADFESGSLINRAKALIPVLIPLFVSAFNRAEELATAMECRCYRGGEGRTRMTVLRYAPRDLTAVVLLLALCAAIVTANMFIPGFRI